MIVRGSVSHERWHNGFRYPELIRNRIDGDQKQILSEQNEDRNCINLIGCAGLRKQRSAHQQSRTQFARSFLLPSNGTRS